MRETRPKEISALINFLQEREPLMYLFLLNTKLVEDNDIPTACVGIKNGLELHYNKNMLKLKANELYFILVHEAQHVFKNHFRMFEEEFNSKNKAIQYLVNVATDAIINREIKEEFNFSYFKEITTEKIFIDGCVEVEPEYIQTLKSKGIEEKDGMISLKYFYWLKDKINEIIENSETITIEFSNGEGSEGNSNESGDGKGSGSGNSKTYKKIDTHSFSDESENSDEKDSENENGENDDKAIEVENLIERMVSQAAKMEEELKSRGNSAGKETGSMATKVKELNKAKNNWKQLLRKRLHTFQSLNVSKPEKQKSFLTYLLNPKSKNDMIFKHYITTRSPNESAVIIAVDTSGSCFCSTAEQKIFYSEIDEIAKQLKQERKGNVYIVQWDTKVQGDAKIYKQGDWKTFPVLGGGGTDPNCVIDWIDKNTETSKSGKIRIKNGDLDITIDDIKKLPFLLFVTDGYFFENFKKKGLYENSRNILFFTETTKYLDENIDYIRY